MKLLPQSIVPLETCTERFICGGKAHALAQLIQAGYRTPPGVVLLDALLQSHLERSGLTEDVECLAHQLDILDRDQLMRRSAAIRDQICRTPLAADLVAELAALYQDRWHDKAIVARSSAVGEDSRQHSFAGQLDSFLNIRSLAELDVAICRTWASLWSDRCLSYQRHKGIRLRHMGVIVQEQIDAKYSGVLFSSARGASTSEPLMLLEYCSGLADRLVAGEVTPGCMELNRDNGAVMLHRLPAAPATPLPQALAEQLASDALWMEREFGYPLDIEWSADAQGRLHFLQARPITSGPESSVTVWTNANIAENFPEPVSPLLYSIALQGYSAYFRNLGLGFGIARKRIDAMQDALDHLIGAHAGRLYYNLSNIHALLQLAPGGTYLIRYFNDFVGAKEFPTSSQAPPRMNSIERFIEALLIPLRTIWQYVWIRRRIAAFEETVDAYSAQTALERLRNKPLSELRCDLHGFLHIRLRRWNNAALADTAAMVCYGLLKTVLQRSLGGDASTSLHNDLLKGLPEVASNMPVLKLWDLSREIRRDPALLALFTQFDEHTIWQRLQEPAHTTFHRRLLDYLELWGFRSSSELMLTIPTPQERPQPTLALLKTYVARSGPAPLELLTEQAIARERCTRAVRRALTPAAWRRALRFLNRADWVALLLRATQGAIGLRERARMRQARLYVRLRHVVLAIGEKLRSAGTFSAADDVFWLTYQELDELLAGHAMFPDSVSELITQRQLLHAQFSKVTPPDTFSLPVGAYLTLDEPVSAKPSAMQETRQIAGVGACGGRITARAVILRDASEGHLLQDGDIAVTRQTDPGWASVFFLVKGLVVERGGMLSHGAIIAREYGIPAVVGVADATRTILSGDRITVDGDNGVVSIHR